MRQSVGVLFLVLICILFVGCSSTQRGEEEVKSTQELQSEAKSAMVLEFKPAKLQIELRLVLATSKPESVSAHLSKKKEKTKLVPQKKADPQKKKEEKKPEKSKVISQMSKEELLKVLQKDVDPDVRADAAEALCKVTKDTLSALYTAIQEDKHYVVRMLALRALKKFGLITLDAIPMLCKVVQQDEHDSVRSEVARMFTPSKSMPEDIIKVFCKALRQDKVERVRVEMAYTLSYLTPMPPNVLNALCVALRQDKSSRVRSAVAMVIQEPQLMIKKNVV